MWSRCADTTAEAGGVALDRYLADDGRVDRRVWRLAVALPIALLGRALDNGLTVERFVRLGQHLRCRVQAAHHAVRVLGFLTFCLGVSVGTIRRRHDGRAEMPQKGLDFCAHIRPPVSGASCARNHRALETEVAMTKRTRPRPTRRGVGYARRSTDRQEQSIGDQKRAVEAYALREDIHILDWYVDDAISGASADGREG
jgi:hypothetical protein